MSDHDRHGRRRHRKNAPREVVREGNEIKFRGLVNSFAHRQYLQTIAELRDYGVTDFVYDFSECLGAFPDGMIPILASADYLRRQGISTRVNIPRNEDLKRLFLNANWAHFLEPQSFELYDFHHERHVAAHRFKTSTEQQALVTACMDVVMRQMSLGRDVIAGLEWSVNEITDNVLNHALCEDGGIVQVSTFREARKVTFGVADSGRGILSSLQEGHPYLKDDAAAIGDAVKAGVTRSPRAGQGNGLAGSMRIATMSGGAMEITSGQAQLVVRGNESRTYQRGEAMSVPGTVVYVVLGLDRQFHISEALGLSGDPHQPVDIIESAYETASGDALQLRLCDEASGFGSRLLGKQIRQKCVNLMNAEPQKPLILDWSGVPLISSSFADELVGKLFIELGPLGFAARIRNQKLESLVRGLIDKAIVQRTAQSLGMESVTEEDD